MKTIAELLDSTQDFERIQGLTRLAEEPSLENLSMSQRIAANDPVPEVQYVARKVSDIIRKALPGEKKDEKMQVTVEKARELLKGDGRQRIALAESVALYKLNEIVPLLLQTLKNEEHSGAISAILKAVGACLGESGLKILVPYLQAFDSRIRANCIEAIEQTGSRQGYPYVVKMLLDSDNRVKANAAIALRKIPGIEALGTLREMLSSTSNAEKASAAFALRSFPHGENVEFLLPLLESSDATVRKNACETLGKYMQAGIQSAKKALESSGRPLPREEDSEALFTQVLEAEQNMEKFKTRLASGNSEDKLHAIQEILEKGGLGIGETLLNHIGKETDLKVISRLLIALAQLKVKGGIPHCKKWLLNADPGVQESAIEAIGQFGDGKALAEVKPFLESKSPRIRSKVIFALARKRRFEQGSEQGFEQGSVQSSEQGSERGAEKTAEKAGEERIERAFEQRFDPAPHLKEMLVSKDEKMQNSAIEIIGEMKQKKLDEVLKENFSALTGEVQRKAQDVLKKRENALSHEQYRQLMPCPTIECSECGAPMLQDLERWVCLHCSHFLPLAEIALFKELKDCVDLMQLPSILAFSIGDYFTEPNPVMKLWHLADTLELTLRLLVPIGIRDLMRYGKYSQTVVQELKNRIEEPTMGKWLGMVQAIAQEIDDQKTMVPKFWEFVGKLEFFLEGKNRKKKEQENQEKENQEEKEKKEKQEKKEKAKDSSDETAKIWEKPDEATGTEEGEEKSPLETEFCEVRNQLAHGGAITPKMAKKLLRIWDGRFKILLKEYSWLYQYSLIVREKKGGEKIQAYGELRGLSRTPIPFLVQPQSSIARSFEKCFVFGNEILFLRKERLLSGEASRPPANNSSNGAGLAPTKLGSKEENFTSGNLLVLWPLSIYGVPEEPGKKPALDGLFFPQMYVRRVTKFLRFTPIGSDDDCHSTHGDRMYDEFISLFQLQEKTKSTFKVQDFLDELRTESQKLIGREEIVKTIKETLERPPKNILWLSGIAGVGKSCVISRVVIDLIQDLIREERQKDVLILPYRFKAGNDRCNQETFIRFSLERVKDFLKGEPALKKVSGDEQRIQGGKKKTLLDELTALLGNLGEKKVIFIIDGLDELAQNAVKFVEEVIFRLELPRILCLCAGRPEMDLPKAFSEKRCHHVFQDGLPRLGLDEIRGMIFEKIEKNARKKVIANDRADEAGENAKTDENERIGRNEMSGKTSESVETDEVHENPEISKLSRSNNLGETIGTVALAKVTKSTKTSKAGNGGEPPEIKVTNNLLQRVFELSDGLPVYVNCLIGEILQNKLKNFESGDFLPIGLGEYFDKLLVGYSQESSGPLNLAILCLLAVAHESLDEEALREILVGGEYLPEEDDAESRNLVQRSLSELSQVIRLSTNADGREGFTLYHDSLRKHLNSNKTHEVKSGIALAKQKFCKLTLNREMRQGPGKPAKGYFLRQGIRHLLESGKGKGKWKSIAQVLTDITFLEEKVLGGMVFDLVADFSDAWNVMPDTAQKEFWYLRLLGKAVQSDVHFLARHPSCLFQTLWNRAWWHDTPEAEKFFDCDPTEKKQNPAWRKRGKKIFEMLERFQTEKEDLNTDSPWVRAARPPSFSLESPELFVFQGHARTVNAVTFSQTHHVDGSADDSVGTMVIASGSNDETLRLWNAQTGKEIWCRPSQKGHVICLAFSPDGKVLASGTWAKTIQLRNAWNGNLEDELTGHQAKIASLAFSKDGSRLVSGSEDKTVRVWEVGKGHTVCCFEGHSGTVNGVAFAPDSLHVLSCSSDKTIRVWNLETKAVKVLTGHKESVQTLHFSHDGKKFVSCGNDQTIRIWDFKTLRELMCLEGPEFEAVTVKFHRDDSHIVFGCYDGTIKVRDIPNRKEIVCLKGHVDKVTDVGLSSSGDLLVSGGMDKTVRLWDVADQIKAAALKGHTGKIYRVGISSNSKGSTIASCAFDKTIRLWSMEQGSEIAVIPVEWASIHDFAFSPNGEQLLVAGESSEILLFDARNPRDPKFLKGHQGRVVKAVFSPDGLFIASGGGDRTVRLWNTKTLTNISGDVLGNCVSSVVFSTDGSKIASGDESGGIFLLDGKTGKRIRLFSGHSRKVSALAFSHDNTLLVSGSEDRTVRVWNVKDGKQISLLQGHQNTIDRVAFAYDNKRVISVSSDRTFRIWDWQKEIPVRAIAGFTDTAAFAAEPEKCPYFGYLQGFELVIEDSVTDAAVAWYPTEGASFVAHPNGRSWVLSEGAHLQIISLEGENTAKKSFPL
ncbi:MAG: HEAT repeat domain-containing protein [Candidatus Ozemobacteraceae bacterium]